MTESAHLRAGPFGYPEASHMNYSNLHLPPALRIALLVMLIGCVYQTAHAQCAQLITPDTLVADDTGAAVGFCVDLDYSVALRGTSYIDGNIQTTFPDGCDYDTLTYYSYGTFPDGGSNGPYLLQRWSFNGTIVNSTFSSIADLVSQMNAWDPQGNWIDDQLTGNIVGGRNGSSYGRMVVEQLSTGRVRNVSPSSQAVAGGTIVEVSGIGYHEFVIDDPNSGCRDTLYLFLRPNIADEEFDVFTDFNTTSPSFCLDNAALPGAPQAYTLCATPGNGTLNDLGGYCFSYTPNSGFSGSDQICFTVCDDTPAPAGPLCKQTLVNVITRAPNATTTDTLRYSITNSDTTVCIDAVIEVAAPYDVAELCAATAMGMVAVPDASGCVSLQPNNNFAGDATVCVRHCTGGVCDTTILIVSVAVDCELNALAGAVDSVASQGGQLSYCLTLSQNTLASYDFSINGAAYTGAFGGCNFEQELYYNYGALFGNGNAGPYRLLSWMVDGQTTSGTFQDPQELESLMQQFDPRGNWSLNAAAFFIQGGNASAAYSSMRIIHDASGTYSELSPNPIDVATGTTITLPGDGNYELAVVDPVSGCSNELTVVVGTQEEGTFRIIYVPLDANTSSPTTCLFTSPRDTFILCGDVSNGVASIDGGFCVDYTPSAGFVGNDTLCALSCSQPGAAPCDTTLLIFEVAARPDTVYISNFGDAPFAACANVPFAGPYLDATLCGVTGPVLAEAGNQAACILIDPDDGVTGQAIVCAEICQEANPAVCQQVIFIIDQIPSCNPGLFATDSIFLDPSPGAAYVCLADGADLSNYTISVNGAPAVASTDTTCGTTTSGGGSGGGGMRDAYFYGTFLLVDGPYRIEGWDINGLLVLSVETTSFADLADSMSHYDPNLEWVYDASEGGVVASGASGNYSDLILYDPTFGSTLAIGIQTIQVSDGGGSGGGQTFVPGTLIELADPGLYEVEVVANDGSCGDRQVIFRRSATVPTRDTLFIAADADQLNGPFCLDTTELGGLVSSTQLCASPSAGTMTFVDAACFTYTPNSGFVGGDTACVVLCSNGGLICDTTLVVFEVTGQVNCPDIWTDAVASSSTLDCDQQSFVCLPRLPGDYFNYTLAVDGVIRTDAEACGADTVTIYSYADVAGRGQAGPYAVEGYRIGSQLYNTDVASVAVLVDSLNQWDPAGAWMLSPSNFTIRGGVSGMAYDTLVLRQIATDTINRLVPVTTLTENQLGVLLDTGTHELVLTDLSFGCSDTLSYTLSCSSEVDCDDLTNLSGNLLVAAECDGQAAFEIESLVTDPALLQVFIDGLQYFTTTTDSSVLVFVDTGSYVITVVDPVRACTSAYAIQVVCSPCTDIFADDTLAVAANCGADRVEICLPVDADVLDSYSVFVDGTPHTGARGHCGQEQRLSIDYTTLPSVGAAGPYSIDSFRINGQLFSTDIVSVQVLADTLSRWDVTSDWSLDEDQQVVLGGSRGNVYSPLYITQLSTGEQTVLMLQDTLLLRGMRVLVPRDAQMLSFDNGAGCVEEVALNIACVTSASANDVVAATESVTFCVDASELTGPVVSLTNACPEAAGAVSFDFDGSAGCVTATGITPGAASTACLVACDAAGVCDTTFYTVTVTTPEGGVAAVDDLYQLVKGETVMVSVTANDSFDVLSSTRIVAEPNHGAAFLGEDGVLTYTPDQDQCGFTDSLRYEICAGLACDTATVRLRIRCGLVEVYTGFSPNGDGINEHFVIEGILDYPDAKVSVFNRWGALVLEEVNYQNDWDGIWDGQRLVSGTYFYLIEFGEQQAGEVESGWVMIWR